MSTVVVNFPEGPREVWAEYELATLKILGGQDIVVSQRVPRPLTGWRFVQTVDGQWIAHREME